MLIERDADRPGPIGLILPTFVQDSEPPWALPSSDRCDPIGAFGSACARLEAAGADALWACDHLFWHRPNLECMTALAVAATATERATLGTCVVQLPLRQAPVVAKQAASIQLLSRGRFVLGTGVGVHRGEYEQAGGDFASRGRQLDEGIVELRRSWSTGIEGGDAAGGARADEGAETPTAHYRQLPAPQPVPVWVGGSSAAALCRAAALADGWMPLFLSVDQYGHALERLAKETDRRGRPADAVTPAMVLFVSVDDDPAAALGRGTDWMGSLYGLPPKAFQRHLVSGTAEEVAGTISRYRQAGARHVVLYVTADDPLDQFTELTRALAPTDPITASPS
ncbi:MAG: LLM class flavin-dependent oxidoreductase [Acidimicrobiales bacterium]